MEAIDFWSVHGWWFIFFLACFPRLTMFFTGICAAFSGFWFWVGWVLAPRFTVAILATMTYWDTNMVLCIITWLWALGGESSEKKAVKKRF